MYNVMHAHAVTVFDSISEELKDIAAMHSAHVMQPHTYV